MRKVPVLALVGGIGVVVSILLYRFGGALLWNILQLPAFGSLFVMAVFGATIGFFADNLFQSLGALPKVRNYVSKDHEIAGHFLGVIGVLYAVVIAFVVATGWQESDHVAELSVQEERDVTALHQTLGAYSAPWREHERVKRRNDALDRVESYALDLPDEWKEMQNDRDLCFDESGICDGKRSASGNISRVSHELAVAIDYLPVETLADLAIRGQASEQVMDLIGVRDHRRHHYSERGLDPSLGWAFLFGAFLLVALSYTIVNPDPRTRQIRTCALCAMIFLMIGLALIFENPFTGGQRLRFPSKDWHRIYCELRVDRGYQRPLKCD
jgi:hypothetical protein